MQGSRYGTHLHLVDHLCVQLQRERLSDDGVLEVVEVVSAHSSRDARRVVVVAQRPTKGTHEEGSHLRGVISSLDDLRDGSVERNSGVQKRSSHGDGRGRWTIEVSEGARFATVVFRFASESGAPRRILRGSGAWKRENRTPIHPSLLLLSNQAWRGIRIVSVVGSQLANTRSKIKVVTRRILGPGA